MTSARVSLLVGVLFALLTIASVVTVRASGPVSGTASHYGPGYGTAMPFCTWTLRHESGCGLVRVTSTKTGRMVTVPVVDFCLCRVGDSVRVIDLQYGVVTALGLPLSQGLYPVTVELVGGTLPASVPDTAVRP